MPWLDWSRSRLVGALVAKELLEFGAEVVGGRDLRLGAPVELRLEQEAWHDLKDGYHTVADKIDHVLDDLF